MQFIIGIWLGALLEEIASYEHWFGDPHPPLDVVISWGIVFAVAWAIRKPVIRWIES